MTSASLIGMSVAVVGLLAVLGGIGIMLTCARKKIHRGVPHHHAHRHRGHRHHREEDIGPYGRGFPPSSDGVLVWREPPPRYTSQTDLSPVVAMSLPSATQGHINEAFTGQPEGPPPCYSSNPDISIIQCEFMEPPPSYTSRQDLANIGYPSLERVHGRQRASTGSDRLSNQDIQGITELHQKYEEKKPSEDHLNSSSHDGCDMSGSPIVCVGENPEVLSGSKHMIASSDSLYDGLSQEERQLLANIVQTAPPGVLTRDTNHASSSSQFNDSHPSSPPKACGRPSPSLATYHMSMPELPETHHMNNASCRPDTSHRLHAKIRRKPHHSSTATQLKSKSVTHLPDETICGLDTNYAYSPNVDNLRSDIDRRGLQREIRPSRYRRRTMTSELPDRNETSTFDWSTPDGQDPVPTFHILDASHLISSTSTNNASNC